MSCSFFVSFSRTTNLVAIGTDHDKHQVNCLRFSPKCWQNFCLFIGNITTSGNNNDGIPVWIFLEKNKLFRLFLAPDLNLWLYCGCAFVTLHDDRELSWPPMNRTSFTFKLYSPLAILPNWGRIFLHYRISSISLPRRLSGYDWLTSSELNREHSRRSYSSPTLCLYYTKSRFHCLRKIHFTDSKFYFLF